RSNQLNYVPTPEISHIAESSVQSGFFRVCIQRTVCLPCPPPPPFSGGTAYKPPIRIPFAWLCHDVRDFNTPEVPERTCRAYGAYRDIISEFSSPASAVALALARQAGGDLMDLADSLEQRTTALAVSDVAELLNISERQVYKLASDGS